MEYKYLELSGRDSGKTTRLLNQLVKDWHRDPTDYRYLLLLGEGMRTEFIDRMLFRQHNIPQGGLTNVRQEKFRNYDSLRGASFDRIYIDEVDFLKRKRGKEPLDVYTYLKPFVDFCRSWYVVGTPEYIRDAKHFHSDDVIYSFLHANNFKYETYFNPDFGDHYPDEVSDSERFGLFLK